MEQEDFSPQQSLAVIQGMIAKTRNNMGDNAHHFLLWGWVTFAALVTQFLLKHVMGFGEHYLVWLVMIPTAFVSIYIRRRQNKTVKATSYVQDGMKYLWMGMGISFFVLSMIFSRIGWDSDIYPFFIMMYGLGTFVSGKILQFTPLVAGGIAAWIIAIAATYVTYDYQMLCAAAAIMASYIVPAYILRRKNGSVNTNK
jgi:hypothetical protein